MPKVDIPFALIKSATIGGIAMVWVNFTLSAFKMAWHIVNTSQEEEETWKPVVKKESCVNNVMDIFGMMGLN